MAGQEAVKVTEEQAADALRELVSQGADDDQPQQAEAEPEEHPAAEETSAAETEEVAASPVEAESDDVVSLKKRNESLEAEKKQQQELHDARWKALQDRNRENERILRERYVRKASVANNALRVLKATRTPDGATEADVDRVIREMEGTMNPQSASYVPPEAHALASEDQAIALNAFLNEKGMTQDEADQFGNWIRSEGPKALSAGEQAVAGQSLDGFLRIAHSRWQQSGQDKKAQQSDAVAATKSVQRTQREAARAATASGGSPRRQPAGPAAGIDVKKLTKDDVAALLRQSVEQYR